jgi:hypothetical protein
MATQPVYSVEEARALIPEVRAILLQLAVERRAADDAHADLHHRVGGSSADEGERRRLEARVAEHRSRIGSLLDLLEARGVVVRDLSAGLIDLPGERDGEPIWLCWRLDDPELGFWHTRREGYASRRPL